MEEKLNVGKYWSKIKDMKNSTVQISHVSKFRVKVKNRNGRILDFDKTKFLEDYEPKVIEGLPGVAGIEGMGGHELGATGTVRPEPPKPGIA